MYKGALLCQGCGKPGSEEHRYSRDQLCIPCGKLIQSGRAENHCEKLIHVRDWWHGLLDLRKGPFESLRMLDDWANSVFKAVSISNDYTGPRQVKSVCFMRSQPHGSLHHTIPSELVEPFTKLAEQFQEVVRELNKKFEEAKDLAKAEVEQERDRIYSEGVDKGRSLLFGLNEGTLSLSEFESKLKYNVIK